MHRAAPAQLERAARQVALPRRWYLSRTEVMARYGVTAQRVNGWRVRARRPLPAPVMVFGDPYWHILHLVEWEHGTSPRLRKVTVTSGRRQRRP